MERRLAVILVADAVGYSRLVGEDEEAALGLFNAYRDIIGGHIQGHRGRVFGSAGDSVIAEFASPAEAVRCAIEIQQQLAARNAGIPPDRRMPFRIGLNLGDVVVEDGNLLGDGVNIAARLEGVARPGGICVSEGIYERVKHLPDLEFQDLGQLRLKNIPAPVRAFAVTKAGASGKRSGPRRRTRHRAAILVGAAVLLMLLVPIGFAWKLSPIPLPAIPFLGQGEPPGPALPEEPSIAVLPLENVSGDPSQEYFSDGLTNDITTDLSKFSNLFVIASNSAFVYKDKPAIVQEVSRALGVRYLLEGTVHRHNERLRINAQLIDATTGHHLWAERYDRVVDDIFAVQDDIVQTIVTTLAVKVDAAERKRVRRRETTSMNAYDRWLQARAIFSDPSKQSKAGNDEARALLQQAIQADPNYARAYGHLSYAYLQDWQNDWSDDPDASLKKAYELAQKAVALDGGDYDNRWSLAIVYAALGDFDKSFDEYQRARALNPNDPDLLAEMGEALIDGGRSQEAVAQVNEAIRRNPSHPYWYLWTLGRAYYMTHRYKEAIDAINRMNEIPTDARLVLAASYAQLGDLKAARAEMAQFRAVEPDWTLEKSRRYYYKNPADREHWLDGLGKAGLPP